MKSRPAIASIGDVGAIYGASYASTPDGYPDLLVGAPDGNSAFVYSGANGALLYSMGAATLNPPGGTALLTGADRFGEVVAGVGDVNGDSVPDFLVGARQNALGGTLVGTSTTYAGAAFLLSGAGGGLLNVFIGSAGPR